MSDQYIFNSAANLNIIRNQFLKPEDIGNALVRFNEVIGQIARFEVDIFPILGMRNLSSFVGEVFAASLIHSSNGMFVKNPHQDGYPDLLLMDEEGRQLMNQLNNQLRGKGPFSPFATGGIEVKATCGSLPTPAVCMRRGFEKPDMGDTRINVMQGYDWKAHHRDTNRLLGILWDFKERIPYICAVFYCDSLTEEDWGKIVQPREGGGRTTSVSIMTRAGVNKMYNHWIAVCSDARYAIFLNRYNRDSLIPTKIEVPAVRP